MGNNRDFAGANLEEGPGYAGAETATASGVLS
jgi:hypothetical protein